MQLARILQSQGFGSRKTCSALISAGHVTVNTQLCQQPDAEFSLDSLHFTVDGTPWQYRAKAYILMHKPIGYECSRQPQHHPAVFSLLPPPLVERGVQCVGRLDHDTTGLLLLSDDGAFIHHYSSPKKRVNKMYAVTTRHPITAEQVHALLTGVLLHDETTPLAAVACETRHSHLLHLTIAEGKYHQVKRMVAAAGNRVERLHRLAIGSLTLPEHLSAGNWCWLSENAFPLSC